MYAGRSSGGRKARGRCIEATRGMSSLCGAQLGLLITCSKVLVQLFLGCGSGAEAMGLDSAGKCQ